jgi:hypothetical protein
MAEKEKQKPGPGDEKKAALMAGLRDGRERILSLVASLPAAKQEEIFLGSWSSRELLAHLAGWDETTIRAADEILLGERPSFYEHFDEDWAAYNAQLVREYNREDFAELLALARETHGKLLAHVDGIAAEAFWADRGIRAQGWQVTVGGLLEAERQSEEVHFEQLRRLVEEGLKS